MNYIFILTKDGKNVSCGNDMIALQNVYPGSWRQILDPKLEKIPVNRLDRPEKTYELIRYPVSSYDKCVIYKQIYSSIHLTSTTVPELSLEMEQIETLQKALI